MSFFHSARRSGCLGMVKLEADIHQIMCLKQSTLPEQGKFDGRESSGSDTTVIFGNLFDC
jgi:hypothetical protein